MEGDKRDNEQNGTGSVRNEETPKRGSFIKELFGGSMITEKLILKNLGFVLFLTLLGAVYISNRFQAERMNREINELTEEVSNLRAESIYVSSELMDASRQSTVFSLVKEKGLLLEELKVPPFKIIKEEK